MVNYFELYELPISFTPDAAKVKAKYYELSKKYHPDRYTLSGADEQAEALKISSLNNEAYKTLQSPYHTMAYVLKLNNLLEEEEKYNLPPDFLMEMMDLNEAVSDYEMETENTTLLEKAKQILDSFLSDWQQQLTPLIEKFEPNNPDETLLLQMKELYFKKKYLLRIQERMQSL